MTDGSNCAHSMLTKMQMKIYPLLLTFSVEYWSVEYLNHEIIKSCGGLCQIDDAHMSSLTPIITVLCNNCGASVFNTEMCWRELSEVDKKAQLSLTNPRDAKVCQKLLQFDEFTTLSLTILAYLHSFTCCCVRNLRNPAKFNKNSNLWSSRSSKVIDHGVIGKPICDFVLVINSNFSRICYRFRHIHG